MSIIVKLGDLTQINCDAIINPANSYGYMGGGVAGAIKRVGGAEIEKEVVKKAPIIVGKAVSTSAGRLPCKYVIHTPTMKRPKMRTGVENVRLVTQAALRFAKEMRLSSIAIPGMGTGVGGVAHRKAAETIVKIAKEFENSFETIFLVDRNKEMIDSFNDSF